MRTTKPRRSTQGALTMVMRRTFWLGLLTLAVLFRPGEVQASFSEPDAIFWGTATLDSAPMIGSRLSVRKDDMTVASYRIGDRASVGDAYILHVPLNSGADVSPEKVQVGDVVSLYLDDILILENALITDRGTLTKHDFAFTAAGGIGTTVTDFDDDGAPDEDDNCARIENPGQEDANANGIGDACEDTVNPTPTYIFVGNVNNPHDPDTTPGTPEAPTLGAVPTSYQLATAEVTNAQYASFLVSVAFSADPAGLYNDQMRTDPRGGIERSGSAGAYSYKVKANDMGNKPVNFVSWSDAARYVNWVENGMPIGVQTSATTEAGAFDMTVEDPGATAHVTSGARWSLPSEDQWYKAAYYDPDLERYFEFPTRADSPPAPTTADELGDVGNPSDNAANYDAAADWNGQDGNVVTVDDTTSVSPYGVADMGGNVAEWTSVVAVDGTRLIRGGAFDSEEADLHKTGRTPIPPDVEAESIGFRLAQISAIPGDEDLDGIRSDADESGDPGAQPCADGESRACDDNCPDVYNPLQADEDGDGVGDACECDWDPVEQAFLLLGDASGDGAVDAADYMIWAENFGSDVQSSRKGDFNCDGTVDGVDYTIWVDNFGGSAE